MRPLRLVVAASAVVLLGTAAAWKSPSHVPNELTAVQIDNLVMLGKVWGFAKYHHPAITNGTIDWDAALRRIIPDVLAAKEHASANSVVSKWLAELGPPPACSPCATIPADLAIQPDTGWIHDERKLGHALSAQLFEIYKNRPISNDQRYVSLVVGVGNPVFMNEKNYAESPLPERDLRLLAVYRFWNIIAYWYPYRNLISENWDNVLREFVPKLWSAGDSTSYRLALMTLIARINDGHANLWSSLADRPPTGSAYVPVKLRFVEGKVVVAGYVDPILGAASGLRVGDVILAINGVAVDPVIRFLTPYYGASNEPSRLREIANTLTRGPPGAVQIRIERDGSVTEVQATRVAIATPDGGAAMTHDLPGDVFQILDPDVAYLKLSAVSAGGVASYLNAAAGMKVLVIDIRNYPKSFVVFTTRQSSRRRANGLCPVHLRRSE